MGQVIYLQLTVLFIQVFPVLCGPGFSGTGYLLTVDCIVYTGVSSTVWPRV